MSLIGSEERNPLNAIHGHLLLLFLLLDVVEVSSNLQKIFV